MKVLLSGGVGQLGQALIASQPPELELIATSRSGGPGQLALDGRYGGSALNTAIGIARQGARVIPICSNQNTFANCRHPMLMIFQGRFIRRFHASQQRSTMSS